jgi:hypothetical protein
MKTLEPERLSETYGGNNPVCQFRLGVYSLLLIPNSVIWNRAFICRMRALEGLTF